MFNKVILFGQLSEPPDPYLNHNHLPACRLKVETRVLLPWSAREHREWTTVRVFGAQAEGARQLQVGDRVSVEGTLWTRREEGQSTTEVVASEVRRLDSPAAASERAA